MQPTKLLLPAAASLALALVPSCNFGPRFVKPNPPMPEAYASKSGTATTTTSAPVDASYWRKLNDNTLNNLISQAYAQNRDLAATRARLLEARALWRQAQFDYAPTITTSGTYDNTTNSRTSPGGAFGGRHIELMRVGFDVAYELDFFGRVRSSVKAARASTGAADEDLRDLLNTLYSEITVNYLELRGAQAQLAVARENAGNQAGAMRIAEASLKGGRGTQFDVARANALLNSTQAQIPTYEENVARSIHRIAVLCGRNPSDLRPLLQPSKRQPAVPSRVSIVKPADLLRRRPDIRVAENLLAADTARIGIAVADLFPRVTFSGRVGLEGATFSNLAQAGNGGALFGPRITWAFLNLGRVRQQIKAAGHRADTALARYEQTVLLALEEAENALTSYDRERARLRHLEASAASAREASTLARQRYQDGVSDFLTVIDAERVAIAAQNDVVLSRTRATSAWVAIYKAMGGGL